MEITYSRGSLNQLIERVDKEIYAEFLKRFANEVVLNQLPPCTNAGITSNFYVTRPSCVARCVRFGKGFWPGVPCPTSGCCVQESIVCRNGTIAIVKPLTVVDITDGVCIETPPIPMPKPLNCDALTQCTFRCN